MSGVKRGVATVIQNVSPEELRRAEEARRAEELAARLQREELARRKLLEKARAATAHVHQALSKLQQELNSAKQELPDLTYTLGALPEMPESGDVGDWQSHVSEIKALLAFWQKESRQAIAVAEEQRRRRIRTHQAWDKNQGLMSIHRASREQLESLRKILPDVESTLGLAVAKLSGEASYEEIESYNLNLEGLITQIKREVERFSRIGCANEQLASLLEQVTVPYQLVMAEDRMHSFRENARSQAQSEFESALTEKLESYDWGEPDLPVDLALSLARIRAGIASPGSTDFFPRLALAQEKRSAAKIANEMLQSAPPYLPGNLAGKWQQVSRELELIAFGQGELTTNLRRRYKNLQEKSQSALNRAYIFAQLKAALLACGLTVEEDVFDVTFVEGGGAWDSLVCSAPGYQDRAVLLSMNDQGDTLRLPVRYNDINTQHEQQRDLEFDHELCSRIKIAMETLKRSGITVELAQVCSDEHPVVRASDIGITPRHRDQHNIKAQQRMAKEA